MLDILKFICSSKTVFWETIILVFAVGGVLIELADCVGKTIRYSKYKDNNPSDKENK